MFGLFLSPTVAVFALTLYILNYIKAHLFILTFCLNIQRYHMFSMCFQVIQWSFKWFSICLSTVLFFLSSSDFLKPQDVLRRVTVCGFKRCIELFPTPFLSRDFIALLSTSGMETLVVKKKEKHVRFPLPLSFSVCACLSLLPLLWTRRPLLP